MTYKQADGLYKRRKDKKSKVRKVSKRVVLYPEGSGYTFAYQFSNTSEQKLFRVKSDDSVQFQPFGAKQYYVVPVNKLLKSVGFLAQLFHHYPVFMHRKTGEMEYISRIKSVSKDGIVPKEGLMRHGRNLFEQMRYNNWMWYQGKEKRTQDKLKSLRTDRVARVI